MIPDAYLAAMKVEDSAALWEKILTAAPNATSVFVAGKCGSRGRFRCRPHAGRAEARTRCRIVGGVPGHAAQRAGIGQRLVATVAAAQRAHGATGLIVWVIAGNKAARAFYEKLGAELLIEQPFTWDGMDLVEAGYGWRDLDSLVAAVDLPAVLH